MFAVLFFLMLFVLGIGSTVGMGSCILRVIRDQFGSRSPPIWKLASGLAVLGFSVSIVYMTAVLIYMLLDMSALEYKGVGYPTMAHGKPKDTSPCI